MEKAQLLEMIAVCYFEQFREVDLHSLAQATLSEMPETATSLYICGLYYQLLGRYEDARKSFL